MLVVLGSIISNSVGFFDKITYFIVALKLELRLIRINRSLNSLRGGDDGRKF